MGDFGQRYAHGGYAYRIRRARRRAGCSEQLELGRMAGRTQRANRPGYVGGSKKGKHTLGGIV